METALDGGHPDRALELFLPLAGIVDKEVQALQALEPVWARMRAGVRLLPREMRSTLRDRPDWLVPLDPPNVPTLYLYGKETDARMFPSPSEVPDLLPRAQLHGLPQQRHLGFALDPSSFAHAILEFTPGSQHMSNRFRPRDSRTTSPTRLREAASDIDVGPWTRQLRSGAAAWRHTGSPLRQTDGCGSATSRREQPRMRVPKRPSSRPGGQGRSAGKGGFENRPQRVRRPDPEQKIAEIQPAVRGRAPRTSARRARS